MNEDIRNVAKRNDVRHWEIAEEIGISESVFSRWMRHEMPDEKKDKIVATIVQIASKRERS